MLYSNGYHRPLPSNTPSYCYIRIFWYLTLKPKSIRGIRKRRNEVAKHWNLSRMCALALSRKALNWSCSRDFPAGNVHSPSNRKPESPIGGEVLFLSRNTDHSLLLFCRDNKSSIRPFHMSGSPFTCTSDVSCSLIHCHTIYPLILFFMYLSVTFLYNFHWLDDSSHSPYHLKQVHWYIVYYASGIIPGPHDAVFRESMPSMCLVSVSFTRGPSISCWFTFPIKKAHWGGRKSPSAPMGLYNREWMDSEVVSVHEVSSNARTPKNECLSPLWRALSTAKPEKRSSRRNPAFTIRS